MIKRIKAEKFKCLNHLDIPLQGLTILAGLNGSGKSSVIQAIQYMRQCVQNAERGKSSVDLRKRGLHFINAEDVFYQFSSEADVEVLVGAEADGESGTEELNYVFECNSGNASLNKLELQEQRNLAPSKSMIDSFSNVKMLVSNRIGPTNMHAYLESDVRARDIGDAGENAVAYLYAYGDEDVMPEFIQKDEYSKNSKSLLQQVGAWLRKVSRGVSVFVDSVGKTDTYIPLYFKYGSGPSDRKFRPTSVGAGLSIVLPVLVLLLSAKKGDCLIIENPESDLHPRGQAELAKLIAKAAQAGVQVIIETHSDHIVNGIRVAVKKGIVSSQKVNIVFFRKVINAEGLATEEQYSDYDNIELDGNGSLSRYPSDFMEEWGRLMDLLLEDGAIGESEESADDCISQ